MEYDTTQLIPDQLGLSTSVSDTALAVGKFIGKTEPTGTQMRGVRHEAGRWVGIIVLGLILALTPPAVAAVSNVRVLLKQRSVKAFQFGVEAKAVVRSLDDDSQFLNLTSTSSIEVKATSDGFVFGKHSIKAETVELVTANDIVLTKSAHYRGRLRFHRTSDNRLQVVNVVSLDHYLASVVDGEMPIEFGEAARMAQAVAARTYVLYHIKQATTKSRFDVYADVQSQKYLGLRYLSGKRWLSGETNDAHDVIDATRGIVLLKNGQLLCSYFNACCGGVTTDGAGYFSGSEIPAVQCATCNECPLFRWKRTVDNSQVKSISQKPLAELESVVGIGKSEVPDAFELRFRGDPRAVRMDRVEMSRKLFRDWPSDRFGLSLKDGQLIANGRGHGHGVGLCQWGARGMARKGRTCLQILGHYYPESTVVRLEDHP